MSRPQPGLSSFNAILSSKGRVTVPAKVRLALHLSMGDRVEFVEVGPGRIEFVAATRSVTELKGRKPKTRAPNWCAACWSTSR